MHGQFKGEVRADGNSGLIVNGKRIAVYACMNAKDIPWGEAGADYVCESTGIFTEKDKASVHLEAGAKKVLSSCTSLLHLHACSIVQCYVAQSHMTAHGRTTCLRAYARVLASLL